MKKILIVFCIVFLAILAWDFSNRRAKYTAPAKQTTPTPTLTPTPANSSAADIAVRRYQKLMTRISATQVCKDIVPVHIYREVDGGKKYLHATGGKLVSNGNILTSAHSFWETPDGKKQPWKYHYHVLQPKGETLLPINHLGAIDVGEGSHHSKDAIICLPGEAQVIAPITPPASEVLGNDLTFEGFTPYMPKRPVKCTVTGETGFIIGSTRVRNGQAYFVLDRQTFPTQSGTLYVDAECSKVYIVSRSIDLTPAVRKVYGLDESYAGVSMCSSVRLEYK